MHVKDLVLVVRELVFGAADDTKVGRGLLVQADGHLKLDEFVVGGGVLHLLHNDALLHLADVLLLDNAHQRLELLEQEVRLDRTVLGLALVEERLAAVL